MRPALLLYCQHSLGLGHLKRSWILAERLSSDFRVVLVSGGAQPVDLSPPRGVEIVELPPLAQDAHGRLVVLNGAGLLEEVRRERTRTLVRTYLQLRPAVVLIELFPFGRRKFQSELIPLLDETRRPPRPIVASSVRDLLVSRGADQRKHDDRARELADAYFDVVLVHTDRRFATLDDTFRPTRQLTTPVCHTGFVVSDAPADASIAERCGIVVSGGGGRFAERLYLCSIDAYDRLGSPAPPMTIVAGPLCPDDAFARVRDAARGRPSIDVQRSVADLCAVMRRAELSVSQCGYNTALDIVRAQVPALVVPFNDNGDSEQTDRAERLEQLNAIRVFRGSLDAGALADAMHRAMHFSPSRLQLDMSGAERTAAVLCAALEERVAQAAVAGAEAYDRLA
jgi:predicted glycosyltransferase